MAQSKHIRVHAKMVLVISHLDHSNPSKEESQSTVKFDIYDKLLDIEYTQLMAQLKTGSLMSATLE